MAESFLPFLPKLMIDIKPQIEEAQRTQNRIHTRTQHYTQSAENQTENLRKQPEWGRRHVAYEEQA